MSNYCLFFVDCIICYTEHGTELYINNTYNFSFVGFEEINFYTRLF